MDEFNDTWYGKTALTPSDHFQSVNDDSAVSSVILTNRPQRVRRDTVLKGARKRTGTRRSHQSGLQGRRRLCLPSQRT